MSFYVRYIGCITHNNTFGLQDKSSAQDHPRLPVDESLSTAKMEHLPATAGLNSLNEKEDSTSQPH